MRGIARKDLRRGEDQDRDEDEHDEARRRSPQDEEDERVSPRGACDAMPQLSRSHASQKLLKSYQPRAKTGLGTTPRTFALIASTQLLKPQMM